VIFDFDGTIADTFPQLLSIGQELTGHSVTPDEIERLRNMPIRAIMKEFKIPYYKVPAYLVQGRKLLTKRADEIELVAGLEDVLRELKQKGYNLQIVSSNSVPIIAHFLNRHKIEHYFDSVHGNVGLFSKAQSLKKIIRKNKYNIDDCLYVGDELRDVEAAHKIKLKIIAVTWGFNGHKLLEQAKPQRLAINPKQLVKYIQELLPA